ncbi:MAG TPA: ATP-binding protein [Myxococcales bacterium]|nr:ATP-binding protein [Myxococcales bacterium]
MTESDTSVSMQRKEILERYAIVDTPPEPTFERLVNLARNLLAMPMAGLAFATEERLFIKAAAGYAPYPLAIQDAFSRHAVETGRLFQVADLARDPRFSGNPQVTGDKALRFFAAAPLLAPGGIAVGALAVMDWRPRLPLEAREQRLLEDLAAIAVDELELRTARLELAAREAHFRAASEQQLAALRQAEDNVRRSERLASLGTLAAGVGHEINNPLSFVVANVTFATAEVARTRKLLAGNGADRAGEALGALAETSEALREAAEGAERVRQIVRDLRSVSNLDAQKSRRVDVASILENALRIAAHEIRHRAQVAKDIAPVPAVMGSEGELTQVFVNLLVNAAHAIPEGAAERHEIRVRLFHEAGRVVAEVADTGVGMPPEVQARIFEPFFTTRAPGAGIGLGLAICHGVVAALGGEISASSEPGAGSVFRVTFPAAPEVSQEPSGPQEPPTERRGRILVIDDEALVGKSLIRVLGREHDVETVTRGKEALELLAAGERYDVILCDISMPEMTGVELYERLVQTDRDQADRVIFISGGTFSEATREFLDRFEGRRFDKPFNNAELREGIRRWLRRMPRARHLRVAK